MNNGKLCVAVIILCLVTPMLVGYAWPVDSSTVTGYEVGEGKNITSDLETNVGVYANYTDFYMNNEFLLKDKEDVVDDTNATWSIPVSTSSSNTGVPDLSDATWHFYNVTPVDRQYNIDLTTYTSGVWFFHKGNADSMAINYITIPASTIIYFPESRTLYYVYEVGDDLIKLDKVTNTIQLFYFTADNPFMGRAYSDALTFVDLNEGFWTPYLADKHWYNGLDNRGIEILVKFTANNTYFGMDIINENENRTRVAIEAEIGGDIWLYVTPLDSGGTVESVKLGKTSIYDMVYLKVDYFSQTISLSGLVNMNGFLDDYQQKSRNTVSLEWKDPIEFSSIMPWSSGTNLVKWFIPRTYSNIGTTKGIEGYLQYRDYTPFNAQIQIRNLQDWDIGNTFSILVGYTEYKGMVSMDGKVTIPDVGGKTYDLNNLIIALIDRTVYINGDVFVESSSPIDSLRLHFMKDWICSLYYYPIKEVAGKEYEWERAGFGLDVEGFCMVGLITSAITGIGASLYGRRSGAKVFGVTMVTGIISAVYLIVLMGGL